MPDKKERKVDKSKVREQTILTSAQEVVKDTFDKMRGRIFNIIDASFDEDSKRRKAMLELMRDITGQAWKEMSDFVAVVMQKSPELNVEDKDEDS